MLILRHVHTSWDTVWHLWTKAGASKSEELYLHMTSSVGYLFSSTPKHSLIPWLPFLTEALVLSKEMNFVATSLSTEPTYQMTNTHFPCGRYAWVLNGLFYRVPRQTWHHFLHDFVTSEFFLIFSLWKRRWQCEKSLLLKENNSPCLLQLHDASHLLNTDSSPYTPELCWQQQLFTSPSTLVFLQILPSSSSSVWALKVPRVPSKGQNSLRCNCFPISFGKQRWIFQILWDI